MNKEDKPIVVAIMGVAGLVATIAAGWVAAVLAAVIIVAVIYS